MRKLVLRWEKCIEQQGDYVEKYVCQFLVKILYFSYFRLFKYTVSFARYFTVWFTYQPPLVLGNVKNGQKVWICSYLQYMVLLIDEIFSENTEEMNELSECKYSCIVEIKSL